MPIIKSAIKKMHQDLVKKAANVLKLTQMKRSILANKKSTSAKSVASAQKAIDKASKAGLIHKNKAARLKSQVSKAKK